jgi:hypothetical protein
MIEILRSLHLLYVQYVHLALLSKVLLERISEEEFILLRGCGCDSITKIIETIICHKEPCTEEINTALGLESPAFGATTQFIHLCSTESSSNLSLIVVSASGGGSLSPAGSFRV